MAEKKGSILIICDGDVCEAPVSAEPGISEQRGPWGSDNSLCVSPSVPSLALCVLPFKETVLSVHLGIMLIH